MSTTRIYDLAKTLGKTNKEILNVVAELGITGKTHSSNIEDTIVEKIKQKFVRPESIKPSPESQKPETKKEIPNTGQASSGTKPQDTRPQGQRPYEHKPPYQTRPPYQGGTRPPQQGAGVRPPYQGGTRPPQQGAGVRPPYQGGTRPPQQGAGERPPYQGGTRPPQQGAGVRPPYQGGQRPPQQGAGGRPPYQGGQRPVGTGTGARPTYQGSGGRPYQGQSQRPQGGQFRQRPSGPHQQYRPQRLAAPQPQRPQSPALPQTRPQPPRPGATAENIQTELSKALEAGKESVVLLEEIVEGKVPDKFKKDFEADKVEKFKTRPGMQRAFQAIRKIDQKKFHDAKSLKKGTDKRGVADEFKPQLPTAPRKKTLKMSEGISVKEFAELISVKMPDVIKKFMEMGYMPTINQPVDMDAALLIAEGFGVKLEVASVEEEPEVETVEEDVTKLVHRPPVVTIMGHVDHGKTSLLDAIRETKVTESEAGGITQHIGAYKVSLKGKEIVFLDTPGHEAFTALRARGAKVTDIVILVVAADDGVKPQTIEAIDHAKAAGVPIIVAINKIDKPEANQTKVRGELAELNIIPEDWGGKNIFVEVSAKKRIGLEHLLEMILLQAEVMELKANPEKPGRGVIIESRLDKGRGPIATVLVQNGTLKSGDAFLSGANAGRVRALIDDLGKKLLSAGPSTPVEVIGFSNVPNAGDGFMVMEDERKARQIALTREQKQKFSQVDTQKKLTLDELYAKIKEGEIQDLHIIIKADVQGSTEALRKSLEDITHPLVKVNVIHAAVGGINESDVMLATASNAIVIGFNVRPESKAGSLAEKEGVDVRLYNIIYEAIDDVKKALEGMLAPTLKEKILGRADVRQTFNVSRIGTIAGCYVTEGILSRASDGIRLIRDSIVVYEGKLSGLKRFKDDAKEVQTGYECGVTIENFNDIKVGDIIENFIIEKIAQKL